MSRRAQNTCELCSSVDIHGNTQARSCTYGQAVCASLAFWVWRTVLLSQLCPTATPPTDRWAERTVAFGAGLVGTGWVCGIHSSFSYPAPFLSAVTCWQVDPREAALGTAERLARSV